MYMNTFKLQSVKFSFPFIALFWSIALVLIIFIIIPAQKAISAGPIPIEEVDFSGDFDKLYVSLKVNAIYDWYYERTENGKIAGKEYIISPDGYYYMGLYALDEDIPAVEKLLKATTAYLEGDIDDTLLADAQYETHVFIEKICFFTLEYYNDMKNSIILLILQQRQMDYALIVIFFVAHMISLQFLLKLQILPASIRKIIWLHTFTVYQ